MVRRKVCRLKNILVFALFNLFFISLIFISSYHKTNRLKRLETVATQERNFILSLIPAAEKVPDINVVLVWTRYHEKDFPTFWTNSSDQECLKNCQFTTDRRYFGISDAVIFHSRDLYFRKNDIPPIRISSQIYIYLQQESPSYTKLELEKYDNMFNWTMTYRQDSDVYHPYFRIAKLSPTEREEAIGNFSLQQILQQKTKLVAWVVSHCETEGRREKYVDELEKFIPVDIYGDCGHHECSHNGEGCFSTISKQYKFYLSFENSLCSEYITEKFSNALEYNLVPIVYGGVGGEYETFAPPGSYINTEDFKSPKALAEYLLELDKNPEKYLQYFGWKTKYKVVDGNGWCSLCQQLTEHKRKPVIQSYANLKYWWSTYESPKRNLRKPFSNRSGADNENWTDQRIPACSNTRNFSSASYFNFIPWLWEYGRNISKELF